MSKAQERHRKGIEGVHQVPYLLSAKELTAIGEADAEYVPLHDNPKYQQADERTRVAMRIAQHQRRVRFLKAIYQEEG